MPLRVNMAGVIPIIFAAAIMAFPPTIFHYFPANTRLHQLALLTRQTVYLFAAGHPDRHLHVLLSGGPVQPGRPGGQPAQAWRLHAGDQARPSDRGVSRPRADPVDPAGSALSRPRRGAAEPVHRLRRVLAASLGALGGTSVLIAVGVALDTMRQMESQMMMRRYEGFLR